MTTPRETIDAKAARLLASGALTVTEVDGDRVTATCRGDHGVYQLGHHPRAVPPWWCGCAARSDCSHVTALNLVVKPRSAAGLARAEESQNSTTTVVRPAAAGLEASAAERAESRPAAFTGNNRAMTKPSMTADEVRALPASVDLPTAGRALGIGRTKAYDLARTGGFPCRVLTLRGRSVVLRADLLSVLGITEVTSPTHEDRGAPAVAAHSGGLAAAPEPAIDVLATAIETIPDPVTRHTALALLARLAEQADTEGGPAKAST